MTIHKTEAIILERRDYRETSFLVRLFSPDFGLLSAQVKGARRKLDKYGTWFLPMSHHAVVFYENPHSDLHIISQATMLEPFERISCSLDTLSCASYCLELVGVLAPGNEQSKEIFEMLKICLKVLNENATIGCVVQVFETKILALSGFRPRLDCCVACSQLVAETARFSTVLGGLLCPECFRRDDNARPLLAGTVASLNHIEHMPFERVTAFRMVAAVQQEVERLLRNFIDFHVGHTFRSLEFYQKIRGAYG